MSKIIVVLCFAFLFSLVVAAPVESSDSDIETKISDCEKKCVITLDLQPRCGSDGITYDNRRLLECRDTCGKPYGKGVHEVSLGPCSTATKRILIS